MRMAIRAFCHMLAILTHAQKNSGKFLSARAQKLAALAGLTANEGAATI
jgi:hypothetical protein